MIIPLMGSLYNDRDALLAVYAISTRALLKSIHSRIHNHIYITNPIFTKSNSPHICVSSENQKGKKGHLFLFHLA